jgi:hypothetical protein
LFTDPLQVTPQVVDALLEPDDGLLGRSLAGVVAGVAQHTPEVTPAMAVVELAGVRAGKPAAAGLAGWYLQEGGDLVLGQAVPHRAVDNAFPHSFLVLMHRRKGTLTAPQLAAIRSSRATVETTERQFGIALGAQLPCFNNHAPSLLPISVGRKDYTGEHYVVSKSTDLLLSAQTPSHAERQERLSVSPGGYQSPPYHEALGRWTGTWGFRWINYQPVARGFAR